MTPGPRRGRMWRESTACDPFTLAVIILALLFIGCVVWFGPFGELEGR